MSSSYGFLFALAILQLPQAAVFVYMCLKLQFNSTADHVQQNQNYRQEAESLERDVGDFEDLIIGESLDTKHPVVSTEAYRLTLFQWIVVSRTLYRKIRFLGGKVEHLDGEDMAVTRLLKGLVKRVKHMILSLKEDHELLLGMDEASAESMQDGLGRCQDNHRARSRNQRSPN